MANLFLDGMFNDNNSPSSVSIRLVSSGNTFTLRGLMVSEPTFSAQNSWGTIINDLSNLQDFASMAGSNNQVSWIGASTMCWKGTKPLSVSFDFYLINYKRNLPFESVERGGKGTLQKLVSLASLSKPTGDAMEWTKFTRVNIHGGYVPDVLSTNNFFFTEQGDDNAKQQQAALMRESMLGASITASSSEGSLWDSAGISEGSCTVFFGKKLRINNLLLSRIDVTPSIVEVADQNGGSRRPLYYRVSVSFTGVRALLSKNVENMWV